MREAACLASDQLGDAERAIELFQALLDEDGADEIAISCVTRLALLLEEKGRFEVIATLWENQAIARALAGDPAAAQTLWARAGAIAEERLGDLERALGAYERGAEIGGEECLEALARVFGTQGRIDQVARALERLCAVSAPELLADRALRLAEAYVQLGKRTRAREALEQAVPRVSDATALRQRLAVLYREAEDYAALAALFEEDAGRASQPEQALNLLKEAAELHLERRRAPGPAIPLLERAIALSSDDPALRLRLAQALFTAERYEDAAAVLRDQLARYGARRPKDRALAHYELARVLLASSDRKGALEELDAAARIDPAHPKILHMLARTALEQGEHERAERMFRALLLVAPKEGDGDAPSKSEALIALGEIARARGDTARFDEFVSSAFETAQESAREAKTLEQALRGRDRPDLVARALVLRLSQELAPSEAARCLADLCELHGGPLGDLASVRGGLLGRARSLEEELTRRESGDDEAWAALGSAYAFLGEGAAEARVLQRRVEASTRSSRPPAGPDLYFRLASVRFTNPKEQEQGLELLERALELGLDIEEAKRLLYGVFAEGGEPPRVLDLLERSARSQNDREGLLRVLARRIELGDAGAVREGVALAEELGRHELGDRLLSAAISAGTAQSSPADAAWLRQELAKRYRGNGEVSKALELEEQAAQLLPSAEARPLFLAVARDAASLGETERAGRIYAGLLRDDPENPAVFEPLLELYRQTEQYEALVGLLDHTAPLVTTSEERSRLRLEQAELLLDKLGRKQEATALLRELVRDDPKERRAHARLFELLDAEGREDELIELFDMEIEAQRERGDREAASALTLRLIAWLERHGKNREALEACTAALEHDPDRRELLEMLLRLAEACGDEGSIGDALERLLERTGGENPEPLVQRLLAIRESAGDEAGVERALELGFAARPSDVALCDRLAELYGRRGDASALAALFERASAERPGDRALAERQIETYRNLGRHEKALEVLAALHAEQPDPAFVHRTRGAILGELGRHEEAVKELEAATKHDPALFPELTAALERALESAGPEERAALGAKLVDALD
ncbi:MAG TPA: tetratricopeptide repeat protein, partial [Polyangiaceae bacterium]